MVKDSKGDLEDKIEKSDLHKIMQSGFNLPSQISILARNHTRKVSDYFLPTAYSAAIIMGFKIPLEMEMMDFTITENVILNAKLYGLFQFAYGPYLIEAAGKPFLKKLDDYLGYANQRSKDLIRLSTGLVAGFALKSVGYELFTDKVIDEYWGAALAVGLGAGVINDLMPHFKKRKILKYGALALATAGMAYGYGSKLDKLTEKSGDKVEQKIILYNAPQGVTIDQQLKSQTIIYNVGNNVYIPKQVIQEVILYHKIPVSIPKLKLNTSQVKVKYNQDIYGSPFSSKQVHKDVHEVPRRMIPYVAPRRNRISPQKILRA